MANVNLKVDGLCYCQKYFVFCLICVSDWHCICVMLLEKSLDVMNVSSGFSKETSVLCCYTADGLRFNILFNA